MGRKGSRLEQAEVIANSTHVHVHVGWWWWWWCARCRRRPVLHVARPRVDLATVHVALE